jgi:hypothetical protein
MATVSVMELRAPGAGGMIDPLLKMGFFLSRSVLYLAWSQCLLVMCNSHEGDSHALENIANLIARREREFDL